MHPSQVIRGRKSSLLAGKKVVVAVTGSIAAVEAVRLIRELIRHGAEVIPVMSRGAADIVTPSAIEFAAGRPPVTEITGKVEHVQLFGPGEDRADLLLIAPATANTLSKIAMGISDNAVTTCASMAFGAGVPVLVSPAMHGEMEHNPFVAENVRKLESAHVTVIPPRMEEGEAKLPPPEVLAAHVLHRIARGPLSGKAVVVIGGSTIVPIDEVRHISNGGSGRMAIELASWAFLSGASVSLWMGEASVPIPEYIPTRRFKTRKDLDTLLGKNFKTLKGAAAILVPAAISDYDLAKPRKGKIDSAQEERLTLELVRTSKLLKELRRVAPRPTKLVGFKLVAGGGRAELVQAGNALLESNHLDAVMANAVGSMGSPHSTIVVIRPGAAPTDITGPKEEVALRLLELVGRLGT